MYMSVTKDVRFYGLLKTLGTTPIAFTDGNRHGTWQHPERIIFTEVSASQAWCRGSGRLSGPKC